MDDPSVLYSASRVGWPAAHGGVEPAHILEVARRLLTGLQHAQNANIAAPFATAYAAVVPKLQDQNAIKTAAEVLRSHMEQAQNAYIAAPFATAYAAVVPKLQDQNAIKTEAEVLRSHMEQVQKAGFAFVFATAYAAAVPKLQDQNAIKTEAEVLGSHMEQAQKADFVTVFAGAYAAVVPKLQDQNAAEALRSHMEQAQNSNIAGAFATAYAAVTGHWLKIHRDDRGWEMQITRSILAMAGQPFLQDATVLLATLEPLAGRQFGNDIGAGVAWWVDKYKGDPASLRPPLPVLK